MGCLAAKPEPKYKIGARVVIDISQKDVSEYARRNGPQQSSAQKEFLYNMY